MTTSNMYLFKALGGNTRTKFKVNSRDTRMMFLDAVLMSLINFEHISELVLVLLMLTLNRKMFDVIICKFTLYPVEKKKLFEQDLGL